MPEKPRQAFTQQDPCTMTQVLQSPDLAYHAGCIQFTSARLHKTSSTHGRSVSLTGQNGPVHGHRMQAFNPARRNCGGPNSHPQTHDVKTSVENTTRADDPPVLYSISFRDVSIRFESCRLVAPPTSGRFGRRADDALASV